MKKYTIKRRFVAIFAFLAVLSLQIMLNLFVEIYRSLPDEPGAMYLASRMVGYDWTYVMTHPANYYGSLTFPLMYPFFFFVKDPLILYQCLLGVGAFLRSLPVLISFYIMVKYYKLDNIKFVTIISMASVFFTPTRATNIDNEPVLILCCWVIVWVLISLQYTNSNKKRTIKSVLLALILCISLLAHTRAILYSIAVIIVLLLYHFLTKKRLVSYVPFIVTFLILYKVSKILVRELTLFLFPLNSSLDAIANTSSGLERQISIGIESLFSHFGIQSFLDLLTSNLTVIFVFSSGIILFCYWTYFISIWNATKNRLLKQKTLDDKNLLVPLSFCLIGGGGAIIGLCITWLEGAVGQHLGTNGLTRGHYYLRYYANFFSPLLLLEAIFLYNELEMRLKKTAVYLSIGTFIFCAFSNWLSFLSSGTQSGQQSSDWFYYFSPLSFSFSQWPNANQTQGYFFSAMFISLLLFICLIVILKKKKYFVAGVFVFLFLFYQYTYMVIMWDRPYCNSENYFQAANSTYKMKKQYPLLFNEIDTLYYDNPTFGAQYIVQLIMMDIPVRLGIGTGQEDAVILTSYFPEFKEGNDEQYNYLPLDNNEYLFIKGERYKALFGENGIGLYPLSTKPILFNQAVDMTSHRNVSFETDSIQLIRGTYELNILFRSDKVQESGIFEVVVQDNNQVIATGSYNEDDKEIKFSIASENTNVNIRFYANEGVESEILSVGGWRYKSFEIGIDDYQGFDHLVDLINDGNKNKLFCLTDWEDDISLKTLDNRLNNWQIEVADLHRIKEEGADAYIIALNSNDNWIDLLNDYIILANYDNYKLMVPNNCSLIMNVPKEQHLSFDKYISLSIWNPKNLAGYNQYEYKNIPAGQYEVILTMDLSLTAKFANVEIYNGSVKLDCLKVEVSETVVVQFESYYNIEDLKFFVYDDSGNIYRCRPQKIRFLSNPTLFIQERYWSNLLSEHRNNDDNCVVLYDGNQQELKKLENYFVLRGIDNIDVRYCDYDVVENWNEIFKDIDTLFLPNQLSVIYKALNNGYAIINRSEQFVYLSKKRKLKNEKFSEGSSIKMNFFDNITPEGFNSQEIHLPEGIYQVNIEIDRVNYETQNVEFIGTVQLFDEDKIIKEIDIYSTTDLPMNIEIGSENGINNLKMSVYSNKPGGMNAVMKSITRISDGYYIDLNKMSTTSDKTMFDNGHIYIQNSSSSIIYGPYLEVGKGKYCVYLYINASDLDNLEFDVTGNMGGEILGVGDVSKAKKISDYLWEISIDFEVNDEQSLIEFRSHIPELKEFCLEGIKLIPYK